MKIAPKAGKALKDFITAALFLLLLSTLNELSRAGEIHMEHSYSWGNVWVSAGNSEIRTDGSVSLCVFSTDVRADFRFNDGKRVLIAAGQLEFDPATGDFKATGWPFVYAAKGETIVRYVEGIVTSFIMKGGRVSSVGGSSHPLSENRPIDKDSAIKELRRKQLSKLEERL